MAISAFALATGVGGYYAAQKLFNPKPLTLKPQLQINPPELKKDAGMRPGGY